jgi:hypothetical protein
MKRVIPFLFLAILFWESASALAKQAPQKPPRWVLLGVRKVDFAMDRDVILVGANKGVFKKLQVKVENGSLNMHRMTVEYGNGSIDKIELKHYFKPGDNTRVIDLEAGSRVIRKITIWYDTQNTAHRKARILVYGRH